MLLHQYSCKAPPPYQDKFHIKMVGVLATLVSVRYLVVMSHEINTCPVSVSKHIFALHVYVMMCGSVYLNAKDADMEKEWFKEPQFQIETSIYHDTM